MVFYSANYRYADQLNDEVNFRTGPTIDPEVVIRGRDVDDVAAIDATCFWSQFGKIVLLGGKIKGSAHIHH